MSVFDTTPGAGWSFRGATGPVFTRVERVSERVYCVVEDDRFNEHPFLYILVGRQRCILIDTGVGTASYREWLEERFLKEVLGERAATVPILVINTHVHFDHVGGNAGLADRVEAVAASDFDKEFTRAALDPVRDASLAIEYKCPVAAYDVTRWLRHDERLALDDDDDGDALRVLHTPGHTPDSLCLWLEKDNVLFAGDTLYPFTPVILANRDSDLALYRSSLELLVASTPPDAKIACGHVTHALPADTLTAMLRLVSDIIDGTLKPAGLPPRTPPGRPILLFERDSLSVTVRADDPCLPIA